MRTRLTKEDKEFINYQMRGAKVLAFLIISFGGFYNFFYFSIPEFQIPNIFLLLIDLGVLLFAWLVYYYGTRKYYLDLQEDYKNIKLAKIMKKESYESFETGSGSLYIPVLGNLFPKLFSLDMKSKNRYYFFVNNTRMRVDADSYNRFKEGDEYKMYYTPVSGIRISEL
ncbi:MAG: hypothetical protein DSY76_08865 [Bacteroidetes bacterium]|nr:MAG: hypothetical protein DSY76_08865 [Bacteroidota bacterium]